MSIDLKTIKHISKLSRISVDDKKAEKLAGDLNSIFDFIEKLSELKTDNVQPSNICSGNYSKIKTR
jgi:aspartyl-tRNA(Asn)/glutamyl-tRNA(Gln) amidotransferase subunit C